MSAEQADLCELLAAFACDAVHTQQKLDAATAISRSYYEAFVRSVVSREGTLDAAMVVLLHSLAPPEICVREFQFECRSSLRVERSASVSLRARPLNCAYERIYRRSRSTDNVIRVEIAQVPIKK